MARRLRYWDWIYLQEVGTRGFQIPQADTDVALEALLAPDALYLGRQVAADWNLGVGSVVEVMAGGRVVRLRVVGLIHHEAAAFVPLGSACHHGYCCGADCCFNRSGGCDRIELVTTPDRPLDNIIVSVRAVLPPHLIVQRPAQRTKQVENMVWAFQLNLSVMSWVGLLVGVFLIYNTIAFAVAQRRREIGIYRALGMTERRVAGLFLVEAGLLGLLGGLLGGLGGVWLSMSLVSLVSRTVSDLYAPVASSGLILSMDMLTLIAVAKGVLLGTVVSMVGALGPSVEAGRTVTVRALAPGDYESTQSTEGRPVWMDQPCVVGAGRPLLADGSGWRPAALWLFRDNLSLRGPLLSCADSVSRRWACGALAGRTRR